MRTARSLPMAAAAVAVALLSTSCASKSTTSTGATITPGASLSGADAAKAALPAAIKAKGSLTVATDPSYAPIESYKPGTKEIVGFDPDLAAALGDVLGVKLNLQPATFDGIVTSLKSGRYDLAMSAMSDTKERQAAVDFVDYFNAGTSIMVLKGNPKAVAGMDSLCGLTIGVENGTVQVGQGKAQSKKCTDAGKAAVTVTGFPDENAAVLALKSGRAQAVLADSPVNGYAIAQSNGAFEAVNAPLLDAGPYGIAVSK
ncbi:MAG: polar amino acid transport system substrate-binding protein, partial [Frankiaceae bacterium]|nr:polar amino acid transport system substrate-binding protein [Frankiaceae bacterium]